MVGGMLLASCTVIGTNAKRRWLGCGVWCVCTSAVVSAPNGVMSDDGVRHDILDGCGAQQFVHVDSTNVGAELSFAQLKAVSSALLLLL